MRAYPEGWQQWSPIGVDAIAPSAECLNRISQKELREARCAVNGLQIETVEERHKGAEITFASGTTLFVKERIEEIIAMFGRSMERTRPPR